jgi:hypothetical protein
VADVARNLGVNIDLLEGTEFTGESNGVFEWTASGEYDRSDPSRRFIGLLGFRVTKRMHEQRDRDNRGKRYNSNRYVSAVQSHFFTPNLHARPLQ